MKLKTSENAFEREKQEIIDWVSNLKNDTSFERLKMLRDRSKAGDWWSEISDHERFSINKGLADVKNRKIKPHSAALAIYGKWL